MVVVVAAAVVAGVEEEISLQFTVLSSGFCYPALLSAVLFAACGCICF